MLEIISTASEVKLNFWGFRQNTGKFCFHIFGSSKISIRVQQNDVFELDLIRISFR